jgi:hypothetical protein
LGCSAWANIESGNGYNGGRHIVHVARENRPMPRLSCVGIVTSTAVLPIGGLRDTLGTHSEYRPYPTKESVRRYAIVALPVVRIRAVAYR